MTQLARTHKACILTKESEREGAEGAAGPVFADGEAEASAGRSACPLGRVLLGQLELPRQHSLRG